MGLADIDTAAIIDRVLSRLDGLDDTTEGNADITPAGGSTMPAIDPEVASLAKQFARPGVHAAVSTAEAKVYIAQRDGTVPQFTQAELDNAYDIVKPFGLDSYPEPGPDAFEQSVIRMDTLPDEELTDGERRLKDAERVANLTPEQRALEERAAQLVTSARAQAALEAAQAKKTGLDARSVRNLLEGQDPARVLARDLYAKQEAAAAAKGEERDSTADLADSIKGMRWDSRRGEFVDPEPEGDE